MSRAEPASAPPAPAVRSAAAELRAQSAHLRQRAKAVDQFLRAALARGALNACALLPPGAMATQLRVPWHTWLERAVLWRQPHTPEDAPCSGLASAALSPSAFAAFESAGPDEPRHADADGDADADDDADDDADIERYRMHAALRTAVQAPGSSHSRARAQPARQTRAEELLERVAAAPGAVRSVLDALKEMHAAPCHRYG